MTLRGAQEVLRLLTEAYPPPKKSHSFELTGGKLILWLRMEVQLCGQRVSGLPLSFTDEDLEREPRQVLKEVRRALGRLGYRKDESRVTASPSS